MPHRSPHGSDNGPDGPPPGISSVLGIDSTLGELPLYGAQLDITTPGREAAHLFNQSPALPGILLTEGSAVLGMLSRYRFLDYLLRPKGCELFLTEPLSVLYSYAHLQPLTLTDETPILVAARAALRRPTDLQGEPILVKTATGDRLLNAHDLNRAHWQIKGVETQVRHERLQAAMLQTEKMAALGRLVDGVAHEILDPLGFIWGNLTHVSRYCQQLLNLVAAYEQAAPADIAPGFWAEIATIRADIELDYLQADLPSTISSIQSGAQRLKQLATSLQNFCHIDEVYPKPADLHTLIDGIVLLLKSRLTTRIHITRHYAPLPPITCFAGQLSQVFMNILTHSVDALLSQAAHQHIAADLDLAGSEEAAIAPPAAPQICITTQLHAPPPDQPSACDRWVTITISDNGPGLSPEAQAHILNSFSVQQRLARETDLATSYRIITAKHGGRFSVRSLPSQDPPPVANIGTEFKIQLPLYDLTSLT